MTGFRVNRDFDGAFPSLHDAGAEMGVPSPMSLQEIIRRYDADVTFSQQIVTGTALGGSHSITISRDGSYTYSGNLRASGWATFTVSVYGLLGYPMPMSGGAPPAANTLVFSARGVAHGSNKKGDRSFHWSQSGQNEFIAAYWHGFRTATLDRRLTYDTNLLGAIADINGFFGELYAFGAALGPTGVAIALAGDAASALNLDQLTLPGLTGVAIVAGAAYLLAPGLMIPVFIAGAALSPVLIKQSRLNASERAFADRVFKGTIPYDRVIKTNLTGPGGRGLTCPGPGDVIFLNIGLAFDDPTAYPGWGHDGYVSAPGQLFIHELTHVWQIVNDSFTPMLFCESLGSGLFADLSKVSKDSVYRYGAAGGPWGDFWPEQQASIVCEWFAGFSDPTTADRHRQKQYPPMLESDENPYYRYIRDNIRASVA